MPFIDPVDLAGLKNATRAGRSAVLDKIGTIRRAVLLGAVALLLTRMAFKKEFIESLSLSSGALLIAFFSALFAWSFTPLPKLFRWIVTLAAPCILAYCLYRAPAWRGAHPAMYDSDSIVVLLVWTVAGLVTSTGTIVLSVKLRDTAKG